MRESISGNGKSTMVSSWLATSRKVPGGEASLNSPKGNFTWPEGNWPMIFLNGNATSPLPGDLTNAANDAGNRLSTTFNGNANTSSDPVALGAADATGAAAGDGGRVGAADAGGLEAGGAAGGGAAVLSFAGGALCAVLDEAGGGGGGG